MTVLPNGMSSKGYAASIARHLRLIVAREQSNWPSPTPTVKDRWRALEAYATFVIEAGDDDPGVVAIWRAQGASLRPMESFQPGSKLQTVIANHVTSGRPDSNHATFVAAAIEDLAATTESRIRSAAGPELERARRDLQYAQDSLERERVEMRRLSDEVLDKDRILGIAETERRELHEKLKRLLEGAEPTAATLDDTQEPDLSAATALPGFPGVYLRQKKSGEIVFAARWPKPGAPGKSESKAPFPTPQAAAEYREQMVGDDPKAAQAAAEEATEERRQREAAEANREVALVKGALARNPGMNQATAEKLVGIGSAAAPKGGPDDD